MTEVSEIDGVGNTTEKQLNELGIETINQLANAELTELQEAGIRNAEKIHNRAIQQGAVIKSGVEVEEEQDNKTYVSTGMQALDRILDGGLEGGFLIGISGESKAGKTQLALQCLCAAADYHSNAVYIETEPNRFQIDRVKSMTQKEESYKRIHKIDGHDADSPVDNITIQYNAYEAVREGFDDVSLIVVDSFIANFRLSGKFESRSDLPERNTIIGEHLQALQSLSNEFDCPILMTLQVQGNPERYGGDFSIWGPVLMDHTITHLIHMKHAKGELKEALLKGHPGLPDDSVTIKIPENAPLEAME
jgi:RecA/RadA recombinase